jgi:hypothetical protein
VLGERWGCARLATAAGSTAQCWDAPQKYGGSVKAWTVPWLRDKALQAGPDRVCDFAKPELTFRCWQRPVRAETEGKELPASQQWLNPNHAGWNDAFARSDRVGETFVGGTFSCLQATKTHGLWCLGDDRFGQLGGSSAVPPANATLDDPAYVKGTWPAERVALGTWHACAMAAPGGLARGGHIACWGRGDAGQLGAPGPDRCEGDGDEVACAKRAQRGVAFGSEPLALYAGDLYTCLSSPRGVYCWGASRDGFFGSAKACPASLRRAWPTLHGSVAAPSASCSSTPAKLAGVQGFQQHASVGPRGICFDESSPLRCIGGIRTPRGGGISRVVVSRGDDASACGLRNGGVVCWGERYSPPGAPDLPLPITLEPLPKVTETAVVGAEDGSGYSASCLVRKGCNFGPAPLPACASDLLVSDWETLRGSASVHIGELVHVRGAVAVGSQITTAKACRASDGIGCCNTTSATVVLGDGPALRLDGLFCAGDDSLACCNAPAYGDSLVASGRLAAKVKQSDSRLSGYSLTGVTLCKP